MEEIRDQMELANEISDVISQPVGGIEMDDVRTLKIALRSSSRMKTYHHAGVFHFRLDRASDAFLLTFLSIGRTRGRAR